MPYNPYLYMQNYQGYQTGPGAPISQPNWNPSPQSQAQQPYDMRVKVKGRNGAEAFWMPPNSHAVLLDEDSDVMYYKYTDAAGYPSIMDFDLCPKKRDPQPTVSDMDYVPRAEFDKLVQTVGELMNSLGVKGASDAE